MNSRLAGPLLFAMVLGACSAAPTVASEVQAAEPTERSATPLPSEQPAEVVADLARNDSQGAISVDVTPRNLNGTSSQLEFEIFLNTHSVDLSMDLAALATLTTDTGLTVPASLWDAPRGGHHVSGTLVFPGMIEGRSVLSGATSVTLTIVDLDAAVRTFEWRLD